MGMSDALRVLWLVGSGQATSRMELAKLLGLPQSTVSIRVQALCDAGVLTERGEGRSQGGRRPRLLAINPHFGTSGPPTSVPGTCASPRWTSAATSCTSKSAR